ncbi:SHOCT domain-containing protein [Gordonia alkaliphila]|uniref:SHOCT domain-containing protein n=1 Tax=Gordonia alkaliphila TaxID=1053547 RepID=UPI001FF3E560|nr:SHOCT domain-containing protein [Gordonia alkaliphila]MCK0440648.1 SHOCT domain-containing protein [Gordonia alkaliphila]
MSLFKTAARAGVASAVHGRVQRRQQQRWAAQGAATPQYVAPAPPAAPATSASTAIDDQVEQLTKLAQLRDAGILTEEEFSAKKAQVLGL